MQEVVEFQTVALGEVPALVRLRLETRIETYSGIYPNDWIEGFDVPLSEKRFCRIVTDPDQRLYFITVGEVIAGYLCYGREMEKTMPEDSICIHMLYLRQAFQRRGIGSLALDHVRDYCRLIGRDRFYNGCNMHNENAMQFYHKKGGRVIAEYGGHENRALNQAVFEHIVESKL